MALTFSTHIVTPGVPFIISAAVETFLPKSHCHLAARHKPGFPIMRAIRMWEHCLLHDVTWDKDALIFNQISIKLVMKQRFMTYPLNTFYLFTLEKLLSFSKSICQTFEISVSSWQSLQGSLASWRWVSEVSAASPEQIWPSHWLTFLSPQLFGEESSESPGC